MFFHPVGGCSLLTTPHLLNHRLVILLLLLIGSLLRQRLRLDNVHAVVDIGLIGHPIDLLLEVFFLGLRS